MFESGKMLAGGAADASLWTLISVYLIASGAALLFAKNLSLETVAGRLDARPFARGAAWGATLGMLAVALLLARTGEKAAFIYFQF